MRLPLHGEMRPDSPALHAEHFCVAIKHVRSLDLLDGTPESPQEHCHKARGSQRSPQERAIVRCTPNHLKLRPDSASLAPDPYHVRHQTRQVVWLPLGNSRDSREHSPKSRGTPSSAQQLEESSVYPNSSRDES